MSASRHVIRMRGTAMTAEIDRRGPGVWRRFLIIALAEQVIHQHDALTALGVCQHLPVRAV